MRRGCLALDRKSRILRGRLNIALIILHADPVRGGAERYTVDLATALGNAGHRVTLAHSSRIDEDVEVNEPGRPFRRIKLAA